MSSGSSASGETRYNWNPIMEAYWGGNESNPGGLLQQAAVAAQRPYQQFGGQRFAGINPDQQEAMGYTRNMARMSSSPIPAMDMARSEISNTLSGRYMGEGPNGNPYSGLSVAANNPYIGGNENMNQNTATDRNIFAGNNPYFRDTLNQGMSDITDNYMNAIAPDLKGQMVLNGTLGGGVDSQLTQKNQAGLAKNLTSFADSMLNQQYNRSAGLEDSFLGRDIQNQQFNKGQNSGLMENQINRGFQNYNTGLDRGMTAHENERNRQMGAIPLGQAEQGLAYQRIGGMQDIGNFQQGQTQQGLDFGYQNWQDQQNWPYKNINWLGSLLSQAQGGNPMNSTMYQGGASQVAPWLGAGLAAYGLLS